MRALGIGEILWDLLPGGPRLGGAPFNVVAHLNRFGHGVRYATAVGDDELGRRALDILAAEGIGRELVRVLPGRPTGTASVVVDRRGSPEFAIATGVAWEELALDPAALAETIAWSPDAIVFGTLAQRRQPVVAWTRRLLSALPSSVRLYDVNLRTDGWEPALLEELASLATVLKLSRSEMEVVAGLGWGTTRTPEAFARAASARFGLRAVCITFGADGAGLLLDGDYLAARPPAVEVVDTVGSGDAFAAALLDGLLRGRQAADVLARAVTLGAFVASRAGALPAWTEADLVRVAGPRRRP